MLPIFRRLVLACIEVDFCNQIFVLHFTVKFASLTRSRHRFGLFYSTLLEGLAARGVVHFRSGEYQKGLYLPSSVSPLLFCARVRGFSVFALRPSSLGPRGARLRALPGLLRLRLRSAQHAPNPLCAAPSREDGSNLRSLAHRSID